MNTTRRVSLLTGMTLGTAFLSSGEEPVESSPVRIIYTQHAQTEWNVRRWNQGHTDTPLNAHGEAMAEAMAKALANERIDAIYSSDLQRAVMTAAPLAEAKGLDIIREPRLRERRSRNPRPTTDYPVLDWPIGNETMDELRQRMLAAMNEIAERHPGQTVLVVSHGAASRQFFDAITSGGAELGEGEPAMYAGRQTAINRLEFQGGQWRIISLNDIRHLDEMNPDDEDPNAG